MVENLSREALILMSFSLIFDWKQSNNSRKQILLLFHPFTLGDVDPSLFSFYMKKSHDVSQDGEKNKYWSG